MRTSFLSILLCVIFFGVVDVVHAQTNDTFLVTTFVGGDTDAPTIPGNFTATPITTSQIDLDWDASSDNVGVIGYQVFRDAIQIATTTLTSYSDTGLTASTTYTYNIIAFDAVPNFSTSTASIATTTFAVVATTTPTTTSASLTPSSGTRVGEIQMLHLTQNATDYAIALSFDTNIYTRAIVRWGRTGSYESGTIASDVFRRMHSTRIDGLEPGTIYEIEIVLSNQSGRLSKTYTLSAETMSGPDIIPPPNVSELHAVLRGVEAELTWKNPDISDFSHVRVLSSDYYYPLHTADGWLVYDGTAEGVLDERSIKADSRRYYTVFVYDESGNISSGAVTLVTRGTIPSASPLDGQADTGAPSTQSPEDITVTPPFTFEDVVFEQENEIRASVGGFVELDGGKNTTISLPYELLPERLKTIVISLTHPDDSEKVFSFLLRINSQKTAYEARIGPLSQPGRYDTGIDLLDFGTREIYTVEGIISVKRTTHNPILRTDYKVDGAAFIKRNGIVVGVVLALLILLVARFIFWRRNDV